VTTSVWVEDKCLLMLAAGWALKEKRRESGRGQGELTTT
jgi:hypothetical protein